MTAEALIRQMVPAMIETVRDPRMVMRRIMGLEMNEPARWLFLLLVAVVSSILAYIGLKQAVASLPLAMRQQFSLSPFAMAGAQVFVLGAMVYGLDLIGRLAGGRGHRKDAILAVAWLQAVLSGVQVLQIVVGLAFPGLSGLLGIAAVVIFFRTLTLFTAEMHGFHSAGAVFFTILLALVALATVLNFLLTLFGLLAPNANGGLFGV